MEWRHLNLHALSFMQLAAGVIYGIYSELPTWAGPGNDSKEETCSFGLSTAQGLVEFQCESSVSQQKWVDDVQSLLRQASVDNALGNRLGSLKLN
jgi:hypothetical protein